MRLLIILISCLLVACSDNNLSKLYVMRQTMKFHSEAELVMPKDINDVVPCSNYGEGCVGVHRVLIFGIVTFFVEFDDVKNALGCAKKIDGLYAANWVFDDAYGEPVLERFFYRAFKAKQANGRKLKGLEVLKKKK